MENISLPMILFAVLLVAIIAFVIFTQVTTKKSVKFLSEEEFTTSMRKGQLIDVRKKDDFEQGYINGSRNIPLAMLSKSMGRLRGDQPIFLVCANGKNSKRATMLLTSKNFTSIYALKGGIEGWSKPLKTKK